MGLLLLMGGSGFDVRAQLFAAGEAGAVFAELADATFEGVEILVDGSEISLLPPQASISGKLMRSKACDHLFILAKSIE